MVNVGPRLVDWGVEEYLHEASAGAKDADGDGVDLGALQRDWKRGRLGVTASTGGQQPSTTAERAGRTRWAQQNGSDSDNRRQAHRTVGALADGQSKRMRCGWIVQSIGLQGRSRVLLSGLEPRIDFG